MSLRIVAIIQARMGSSRLPGKVLLDIAGKAMIQRVVERTRRARLVGEVLIATTIDPSDDAVAAFAGGMGVAYTRGSLHDVLDRYYQAALSHAADVVVRITADCPMIDPELIDKTIALVTEGKQPGGLDFAANRLPPPFTRSFPIGLDVEVCSFAALERAWKESTLAFHREHVMPYIYEGATLSRQSPELATGVSPRSFRIAQLHHALDLGSLRWTVDVPDDLEFARQVFERLDDKDGFSWRDVLGVLQKEPGLADINSGVRHKTMTETDERAKK
jgi:spore coat polysaccharide biosynthesis protein SpsF